MLVIHLHLFPWLFWQKSFIYLFLNSDESIYEAKHEAIKCHSLFLLPLKVSLLPFTASSNVQHFSLYGMLSSKASYNVPLQEPPSRLFASAPGAFKPFYPTTQTRDLGFHPWFWAWKDTRNVWISATEPLLDSYSVHILSKGREKRILQGKAAAWAMTVILKSTLHKEAR